MIIYLQIKLFQFKITLFSQISNNLGFFFIHYQFYCTGILTGDNKVNPPTPLAVNKAHSKLNKCVFYLS